MREWRRSLETGGSVSCALSSLADIVYAGPGNDTVDGGLGSDTCATDTGDTGDTGDTATSC
ncbi:hypothetical protein ABZ815_39305 [Nonomuraea sp. NPDC047529]|uniref:hypothetical protein n=1 Tax=Nonomuraea sp. NPDC047529 TaxID=3155623 RepID=UPI0033E0F5BD